jgi:hypothetical protein
VVEPHSPATLPNAPADGDAATPCVEYLRAKFSLTVEPPALLFGCSRTCPERRRRRGGRPVDMSAADFFSFALLILCVLICWWFVRRL